MEAGVGHQCGTCSQAAVIVDRETASPWCLDCAKGLLKAGDPVVDYEPLNGAHAYEQLLAAGTTSTLRFR
jgi:hypothetical protein